VATESSRDALVDAALAAYRPALAFAASGFYVITYRDSDAFTRKSFGASGGLTMSVPLFDATLGPKLDDAKNDLAAATAVRLQTRVTVRTEARTAALLVERAASRAALAERAAASASEVVAITLARYEKGLAAPLELLTAEADDATARGARVQAAQARALSVVRLLAATGRLAMLGGS
jgi:outer membrane protein TolC